MLRAAFFLLLFVFELRSGSKGSEEKHRTAKHNSDSFDLFGNAEIPLKTFPLYGGTSSAI